MFCAVCSTKHELILPLSILRHPDVIIIQLDDISFLFRQSSLGCSLYSESKTVLDYSILFLLTIYCCNFRLVFPWCSGWLLSVRHMSVFFRPVNLFSPVQKVKELRKVHLLNCWGNALSNFGHRLIVIMSLKFTITPQWDLMFWFTKDCYITIIPCAEP